MPTPSTTDALRRRLRKWREKAGFVDIEAFAGLASLPPSVITGLEVGTEPITANRLEALARALAVELNDLVSADPRGVGGTIARFRTADGAPMLGRSGTGPSDGRLTPRDGRLLARAVQLARIGHVLAGRLGRPLGLTPGVVPISFDEAPWQQGYRRGETTRQLMSPERAPLESVQALLERVGVHVATVPFESEDLEAAALWAPDSLPIILLNARAMRVARSASRRAVLAHELCHLLHDASETRELRYVDRVHNDDPETTVTQPASLPGWTGEAAWRYQDREARANAFAPSFLAPRSWLREAEPREMVRELVVTWGFTARGACWHVKNVFSASSEAASEWYASARRLEPREFVERPPRDNPTGVEPPSALCDGLIADLAIEAAAAHLITEGRAAEILAHA